MIIKMNLILGVVLVFVKIFCTDAVDEEYYTYELIKAIKSNDYKTLSEVYKIIHTDSPTLFNKAINQALKEEYDNINLGKLINYFGTHDNATERIYGYENIFSQMRNRNRLNDKALVSLAFGLRGLLTVELSSEDKDHLNKLKNALPESVRNMAFATKVCIVANAFGRKEPLIAENNTFNYNHERRRIFSWIPGGVVDKGFWSIEPFKDDLYHIWNSKYEEYLYAASYWHVYNGKRSVYTWIPKGIDEPDHEKFEWTFIPVGDFVRIFNPYDSEYLYIQNGLRPRDGEDKNRSIVYTRKYYSREGPLILWKIEDCTNES